MNIKRIRATDATPEPDASRLHGSRSAGGDESLVHPSSDFHLSSDFDPDEAFVSEADAAADTTGPVREAAGAEGRPLSVRIEPTPAGLEDVSDATGSFSIAELLETDVPLDWREAVSIARRMCEAIARHPAAGTHEYHLDPRRIEITEKGDVVVEPGEPGTDPFVKQIGRILRALLEDGAAPAQLRLLVSQAVFDVPGFVSLEEFSEALSSFEKEAKDDAVRVAFRRVRERKYSAAPVSSALTPPGALPVARGGNSGAAPAHVAVEQPLRHVPPRRYLAGRAAAIMVGAGAALGFWLNRNSYEVQPPPPQAAVARTTPAVTPQSAPSAPLIETTPTPTAESPPVAPPRARLLDSQRRPSSATGGITPRRPSETAAVTPPPQPAPPPRPASPSSGALEEAGTRRPTAIVPNAVQDLSLRMLALAFDHYNRARTALEQDDYQQALSEAGRAEALLDTLDVSVAPGELRDRITQLVARADALREREEARVYTIVDSDVIPPAAIGRQMPSTAPPAVARTKIGTLEMVINRDGQVETLKLRTPLNRFHERMIVSAAKAWRYRPALKNGRPVKFLLISSINLPES
jgi:hypothetical protein